MSKIFLTIVNMSISASCIVLAVMLLRLLIRKAPKWITVLLWGIVAVRLVCPVFIESEISLIPRNEWIKQPEIQISEPVEPDTIVTDPVIGGSVNVTFPQPEPNITVEKGIDTTFILACVWLTGGAALLVYTAVSCILLKRRINEAVLLRDNIYQSERVVSPFVLGIIKPKIYLPFNMNEKDIDHVVAHEMAHIRRKDHVWKPLGFLLLTLHWFNPLMWLGYILLCRDIELACDEKVIKELDRDARADYSEALLTCSVNRRMIAACPLAFGEVGVKDRVKSVLSYKKPAFWIIIAAVVVCLAVTACFLTNPIDKDNTGVKSISAERVDPNVVNLIMKYSYSTGSYSVRFVPESEGEYTGDGMKDYDGSLGKYRLLIELGDTEPSQAFMKKYPTGEVVELDNSPVRIRLKRVHPQDHGFALYVGFDSPILVDQIENGKLKTIGGSIKIPINVLSNELIYGFVSPAGDSDKLSYVVQIQDFGCDVKDATINFEKVRFEDGNMIFDIHWTNEGSDNIDIGPDFEVYKYNGSTPKKLDQLGYWNLNREILAGKGMTTDNGFVFEYQLAKSYNLSAHFDVLTPGKYRFEAHGAWVEFQIIDDFSDFSAVYDSEDGQW